MKTTKLVKSSLIALIVAALGGATSFASDSSPSKTSAKAEAKKEQAQHITVTNKLVDGKKTWLPADINVKVGQKVELELVNTLPDPHGFNVPGLAENIVVSGNAKQIVSFTPTKKEKIKFNCQLHPAHVGGHVNVD